MKQWIIWTLLAILTVGATSVSAQDVVETAIPERVELTAGDDLVLVGDVYSPADSAEGGAPAILLMHQNKSNRDMWEPLIPALLEAGMVVLTVDLRAHGETGGRVDWTLAQEDTQLWIAYLLAREGVNPEKVAVMGASIGSNLALVGCAANEGCLTVVALSPGLDYFGVKPEISVSEGLRRRSALLVASRGDNTSAVAVRQMAGSSKGLLGMRVYAGVAHAAEFFEDDLESVTGLIVSWLTDAFAD